MTHDRRTRIPWHWIAITALLIVGLVALCNAIFF